ARAVAAPRTAAPDRRGREHHAGVAVCGVGQRPAGVRGALAGHRCAGAHQRFVLAATAGSVLTDQTGCGHPEAHPRAVGRAQPDALAAPGPRGGAAAAGSRLPAGPVSAADLLALSISLRLAALTTALLIVLGTPLAWWLATARSRWRVPVNALVSLPLVLPPTVLGFYLLVFMGPAGPLGRLLAALGLPSPAFSFTGLVIGSMLYSLPFVVQ